MKNKKNDVATFITKIVVKDTIEDTNNFIKNVDIVTDNVLKLEYERKADKVFVVTMYCATE